MTPPTIVTLRAKLRRTGRSVL